MKKVLLFIVALLVTILAHPQTILLQEDFEGTGNAFTSSSVSGTSSWAISSTLASQGSKSDSASVALGDSIYLTSGTLNCTNMTFVQLDFDHICKLEFFDAAELQYSTDNGVTWNKVTTGYMGAGQFNNIGNKFNSTAYGDWLPANNNAIPTNAWWKHETFNLSTYAANQANFKIRFALLDINNSGSGGNYGWFIDSVVVQAAFSELIPPSVVMIPPILQDTSYTSGPFDVQAYITDGSGIDTALLIYQTTSGFHDTLGMSLIAPDTFMASIPFHGFGRSITYYVKAVDASAAHNVDSAGPYTFFCKNSPGGTGIIGTGTTASSHPFYTFYMDSRTQMLYTASEINASGVFAGNIISIGFDVTSAAPQVMNGFTIKMKATTATSMSSFDNGTGWTTVFTGNHSITNTGWNTFTLASPFVWDGSSNLMIDICFDNSSYTSNTTVNSSSATGMTWHIHQDLSTGNLCSSTAGTVQANRPNLQLTIQSTAAVANDIGVHIITNPTGGVVANQSIPIKVRLKNYGIDTITSAEVKWKFDGLAQQTYNFQDTLFPDSLSTELQLGTKTVSGGAHHLLAWTDNPNGIPDFDVANDSASINFYACSSLLNGTYTIGGTSPDYATFSDAVLALNQCGISGPVTFNVAAGTYTEQVEIMTINGSSATNTVTFQAANGDSTSVVLSYDATGTVDNYVVKLNGASNIKFKSMTIQAMDSNYCRAFVLSNMVSNLSLTNNVIQTNVMPLDDDSKGTIIVTLDSIGSDITISNNNIINGANGIVLEANSPKSGWQITNNYLSEHYSFGAQLIGAHSPVVNNNIIRTSSTFDSYNGFVLSSCTGSASFIKNDILTSSTQIGYGVLFNNSEFDSLNPTMVYNNFIQMNANSSATTLTGGILNYNSSNINYYYNTIHMTGNQNVSAGIILYDLAGNNNSEGIDITNNIVTNAANGYIYYTVAVDTADFNCDYNNYFLFNGGKLGYLNSSDATSLADWQTNAGADANSHYIDPYYTSALDLHVTNNLLNGLAIPIAGITDDIDGDLRNATNPDLGADEFVPSPYDATALQIISPVGGCGLDTNEIVSVLVKNIGSVTINGNFSASYKIGTNNAVTESITDSLLPGDSLVYSFTTPADFNIFSYGQDSTFDLCVWVDLLNDPVHANDTVCGQVESKYQPAPPTVVSPISVTYGAQATLVAVSTDSIQWFAYDTSSVALHDGSVFVTSPLYDTTTFWAAAGAAGGVSNTLTTLFAGGNGSSGNMFDITAINTITIDSFDVNVTSTTGMMEVWYRQGTYVGYTSSNAGWTKLGDFNITSAGSGLPTRLPIGGLTIPAGQTYGIYVTFVSGSVAYTNGNGTNQVYTNADMTVNLGHGGSYFSLTFAPRVWNGNIHYHVGGMSSSSCASDRVPLTVNITGYPQNDAGLMSLVEPFQSVPSGYNTPVTFKLRNYGIDTLKSVDIHWSINGQAQTTYNWTGNLLYKDSINVTVDTMAFAGGVFNVIGYTNLPNNVADTINSNDTTYATFNSCLSGSYTIGDTTGGAIYDFPSFNAALNALQVAGICGHVVFNVDTGTYVEQLNISSITGVDVNNTVTFQSANGDSSAVILEYAPTLSSSNYVIKLNGVKYFTFKNLTIKSTGSTYGGLVEGAGNNQNNNFLNNILISTTSGSSSYKRGFYFNSGLNHYNVFENNIIESVYYGIYLRGSGTTSLGRANVIKNNHIKDFIYYGIYTYYLDSLTIEGNTFEDDPTLSAYGYGIYSYYNDNTHIIKNTMRLNPSSYKYGIYTYYADGTTARRGLIANNMISVNSGTGANYGLYVMYPTNMDIVYNSININSGSSSSRALYLNASNATNPVNAQNNILRDSVGYTVYSTSNAGINIMDYNAHFTTASNFAYWGTNQTSFANFQTTSGKGTNSMVIDPSFMSSDDLHLFSTDLSGYGNPITVVTDDIDGEIRGTVATTIGADEVPLLPFDIGVTKILYVNDSTYEGYSTAISVIVKNFGTDTVNGFDISYTVNGGTPVVYNYTQAFPTGTIDTVALVPFNSPAGNSQICATTVLSADSNVFNDGTCKNFFGVPTKDAFGKEIFKIPFYCGITYDTIKLKVVNIGVDSINAVNQTVPTTVSYKINNLPAVTETLTQVVAPGDSIVYMFNNTAYLGTNNLVDSIYDIAAWIDFDGDNVSYNDTAYYQFESLHQPPPPVVTSPITIPYGTATTLTATSNDNIIWYRYDTSTVVLDTGATYATPYMYATDSFYVAAQGGGSGGNVIIGTGTNTSQPLPLNMFYGHTYSQSIYTPAEFNGTYGKITKIAWYYNGNSAQGPDDIDIYMGLTSQGSFSSTTDWVAYGQLTNVYHGTLSVPATAGWVEFTLQTPFLYDGSTNLVVGFHEYTYGYHNSTDDFYCTSVSTNRSIYYYSDAQNPNPQSPPTAQGTPAYIPNIKMEVLPSGCESQREMVKVIIGAQPPNDMGMVALNSPVSSIYMSGNEQVTIVARNFGTASQSNIPVGYIVGTNPVVWDTIPGPVSSGDSVTFTFSTPVNMSNQGQTYNFKLFTANPGDANVLNDTLNKSVTHMPPAYCACSATSGSYEDLTGISVGTWSHTNTATGAMYTDYTSVTPTAMVGPGSSYPISVTSDFSPSYSTQYTCWTNVFIDFNRDGDFDDPGELAFGAQTQSSNTVTGTLTVPTTANPGITRMRVVLREAGTQANTGPCGTYTWGETEDYNIMILTPISQDAGVELFLNTPTLVAFNTVPVDVQIRNYGLNPIDTVDVSLKINNGTPITISYTSTIQPMDSAVISFGNQTINPGANNLCVYTTLAGDSNTINDQLCKSVYLQATKNVTYIENFEGNDVWMPDTILNQWERGAPTMTNINSAHSGSNVWGIDIDGNYANSSTDYLYSPYMLIPTFADSAHFKFWHYYVTEGAPTGDGGQVQYSFGDNIWATLGFQGDPAGYHWYNDANGGTPIWSGNSNGWVQSSYVLNFVNASSAFFGKQGDTIQFRFMFYADNANNSYDGWAIDDVELSLPKIPQDGGVVNINTPGLTTQNGSTVNVSVDIRNFGSQDLVSIPVAYQVSSGSWVTETFTPTTPLMPDSTATFTFANSYVSPAVAYSFCAKTQITSDIYSSNDQLCKNVSSTQAAVDAELSLLTVTPIWPGTTIDTTKFSFDIYPIIKVTNLGVDTLYNVTVEYSVGATPWVSGTIAGPIYPGDTATHQFATHYKCPVGAYTLNGRITVPGDANTSNNTASKSLHGLLDIGMEENLDGFYVKQNRPNPVTDQTIIEYAIPNTSVVSFELHNTLGQSLRSSQSQQQAGVHTLELDLSDLSNGVYYYTIRINKHSITRKLTINK